MNFADAIDSANSLATIGVPGLVVIVIALASVIIYLYKKIDKLETKIDGIQEQRIADAKEVGTKVTEPLANLANSQEQQGKLMQNIYDLLQYSKRGN